LSEYLCDYNDKQVLDFLKFGWPIGHNRSFTHKNTPPNWPGATNFSSEVSSYLEKECNERAVLGPYPKNPFHIQDTISPLNTCPKKDSVERRVILDLSHPKNHSVNDGICKDKFLNNKISLKYPTVDRLTEIVREKGQGSMLFKRDLRRAYRQIPVDPGDAHYLGYCFKGKYYYDRTLTMGCRSSAYCCQRTTEAIMYIHNRRGYSGVVYIDDMAGAEKPSLAERAFQALGDLLNELGVQESKSKACPPNTKMVFLGIQIDSVSGMLTIDADRLNSILDELNKWLRKKNASLKEIQSLIGSLNFCASCIREGRLFFSRILNFLRGMSHTERVPLSQNVKDDIKWWLKFMPTFNGTYFMTNDNWEKPDAVLSTDACLTGAGGYMQGYFFHTKFPDHIRSIAKHINEFELYTILLALRTWGSLLRDKSFLVYCDNQTSVTILRSGASRNCFSQSCLREIRFWAATYNFRVRGVFLEGESNRIADALSRWHLSRKYQDTFYSLTRGIKTKEFEVLCESVKDFW
jgi:hypothetical protein